MGTLVSDDFRWPVSLLPLPCAGSAGDRAGVDEPSLALIDEAGRRWTYDAILPFVAARAKQLQRQGAGPGCPVAFPAVSSADTYCLIHALIQLGAPLVPLHPRLTLAEVDEVLALARPGIVLARSDAGRGPPAGPREGSTEGDGVMSFVEVPPPIERSPAGADASGRWLSGLPHLDPELPLAIVTTSGTTGRPKGAVLSRRAFYASALGSASNLPLSAEDGWVVCMPLGHVGGLSILTRCLLARASVCLHPRFEPAALLELLTRAPATLISLVPTMLDALLRCASESGPRALEGLRALRAILLGGAAAPEALLDRAAAAGLPVLTTYGLTEACSQVTTQSPRARGTRAAGSGLPLPGVRLRIVTDDGRDALVHERGRILVNGPTLFSGYLRAESSGLLPPPRDARGGFDTGDWGAIDEHGALHVEGRRSDLIVTGGENVSPLEVERMLCALPGVQGALVFGVPDPVWGQRVGAAVLCGEGYSREAVALACTQQLALHKWPRCLAEVEALPMTDAGKPDRLGAPARLGEALRELTLPRLTR